MEAGRTLEGWPAVVRPGRWTTRAGAHADGPRTPPGMGSDAESRALRQESEKILDQLGVVAVPSRMLLDGA